MQFHPDFEKCIRDPMRCRDYSHARRDEIIKWLRTMRETWHRFRHSSGKYPDSTKWLLQRGFLPKYKD